MPGQMPNRLVPWGQKVPPAGDVVGTSDTQVVTNKTLSGANNTLTVREADLSLSDNTSADATTSRHGLLPKLGGGTTNFLRADGTYAAPSGGSTLAVNTARGDLAGQFTTTSSTEVDLTGATITWTPASATNTIVINAVGSWSVSLSGANHSLTIDLDGSDVGGGGGDLGNAGSLADYRLGWSLHHVTTNLSAASHTAKVQVATSGGTLTLWNTTGNVGEFTHRITAITIT